MREDFGFLVRAWAREFWRFWSLFLFETILRKFTNQQYLIEDWVTCHVKNIDPDISPFGHNTKNKIV